MNELYSNMVSAHIMLRRAFCSVLVYILLLTVTWWMTWGYSGAAVEPSVGDGVAVRSSPRAVRDTVFRDAERFLGVRPELAGSHGPHLAVGPHTRSLASDHHTSPQSPLGYYPTAGLSKESVTGRQFLSPNIAGGWLALSLSPFFLSPRLL